MQLHRAGERADWDGIPSNNHNGWQRLAARTYGIATPGNAATFIGFTLVLGGCWQLVGGKLWLGLILIFIGRSFDLVDGWLAEATGTKSPLGRGLDALIDKLGSLAALIALLATQLVPTWLLIGIFVLQFVTSLLSIAFQLEGKPRQPTREGKVGTAIYWVCIFGYVLLAAADVHAGILRLILASAGIIALVLGTMALRDYIRPRG